MVGTPFEGDGTRGGLGPVEQELERLFEPLRAVAGVDKGRQDSPRWWWRIGARLAHRETS
jgi:hypothetical protein